MKILYGNMLKTIYTVLEKAEFLPRAMSRSLI